MENPARPNYKPVVVDSAPVSQNEAPPLPLYTPPPPSTASDGEHPPVPEKKSRFKFNIEINSLRFLIPAILLIITIAAVGYFVNRNLINNQPVATPTPLPTLTPATQKPTPTPKPRAKTYLNNEIGFAFEFSGEFSLAECDNAIHFSPSEFDEEFCDSEASGIIKVQHSQASISVQAFDDVNFETTESLIEVSGIDATQTKVVKVVDTAEGTAYQEFIKFKNKGTNFLITLGSRDFESELLEIIKSFKLEEEDPSINWTLYTNKSFAYSIKYPPEWTLIVSSEKEPKVVEIRKDPADFKRQALVIDAATDIEDPQITASQTITSTQNLSGWARRPLVEYRGISGGTAQFMSGILDGIYQAFVVVWKDESLVQMNWRDDALNPDQKTFDWMLSTFEFD